MTENQIGILTEKVDRIQHDISEMKEYAKEQAAINNTRITSLERLQYLMMGSAGTISIGWTIFTFFIK